MTKKRNTILSMFLLIFLTIASFQGLVRSATSYQGFQNQIALSYDRNIQSAQANKESTLSLPKLYGVNLRDDTWFNLTNQQIDNVVASIRNAGFNFVRLEVYFHRLVDFSSQTFRLAQDQVFHDKLIYILQSLEQHGLFVEPLLMEPWKFGNVMTLWWTNATLLSEISFFYSTFAGWLKSLNLTNIVYITLWSEASYYYEWVDGYYVIRNNLTSYGQANADWRSWLSQNGIAPVDLSMNSINLYLPQYVNWSQTRFNEITQWKANAVELGWPGIPVSAEMGYSDSKIGTVGPYCASKYLNLCASSEVNILNEHDYFDNSGWAMQPYIDANLAKTVVVNELGPPFYLGVYANDTAAWWSYVEPKMELAVANGGGFAIWDWRDYTAEQGPFGLVDFNNNSRPILQLVTQWLANQTITYAS